MALRIGLILDDSAAHVQFQRSAWYIQLSHQQQKLSVISFSNLLYIAGLLYWVSLYSVGVSLIVFHYLCLFPTQNSKILIPAFNVTSHPTITRDSWPHADSVLQKIDLPTTVLITP